MRKLRRNPIGIARLDPVTQRPWSSFEAALAATERSRAIAACPRTVTTVEPKAQRCNWATPEKDALIRQMVRERRSARHGRRQATRFGVWRCRASPPRIWKAVLASRSPPAERPPTASEQLEELLGYPWLFPGRPPKHDLSTWTVTDDWPDPVPVTQAEIKVFERWFGDMFDELFGPDS